MKLTFGNQSARRSVDHFLRVAQLMTVRGAPERNEDRGPSRSGYFCRGDRARPADHQVGPIKALRHVPRKGRNFGRKLLAGRKQLCTIL